MFSLDNTCRYWLYKKPVDMRKSFNGLSTNIGSIGRKTYNRKKDFRKKSCFLRLGTNDIFFGGGLATPCSIPEMPTPRCKRLVMFLSKAGFSATNHSRSIEHRGRSGVFHASKVGGTETIKQTGKSLSTKLECSRLMQKSHLIPPQLPLVFIKAAGLSPPDDNANV